MLFSVIYLFISIINKKSLFTQGRVIFFLISGITFLLTILMRPFHVDLAGSFGLAANWCPRGTKE